jgi:hypothetical protein
MSTIKMIILSEKVKVLKKKNYQSYYATPHITTTTKLLPFVTLQPPPPLYPFHLMLIVGSLLL